MFTTGAPWNASCTTGVRADRAVPTRTCNASSRTSSGRSRPGPRPQAIRRTPSATGRRSLRSIVGAAIRLDPRRWFAVEVDLGPATFICTKDRAVPGGAGGNASAADGHPDAAVDLLNKSPPALARRAHRPQLGRGPLPDFRGDDAAGDPAAVAGGRARLFPGEMIPEISRADLTRIGSGARHASRLADHPRPSRARPRSTRSVTKHRARVLRGLRRDRLRATRAGARRLVRHCSGTTGSATVRSSACTLGRCSRSTLPRQCAH